MVSPKAPAPFSTRPLRFDLVQSLTLEIYTRIRTEGQSADRVLDKVLRRERRLYSSERRAISETVYGLLRNERRLDFAIFGKITTPANIPEHTLFSLRFAAYCLQESAFSSAHLEAIKRLAGPFFYDLEKAPPELPDYFSASERVAIHSSLPLFVAETLVQELGEAEAIALAQSFSIRAPLTIRANYLKTDPTTLMQRLASENINARPTLWSPWGLTLETRVNAHSLKSFTEGLFEIQDEGSQLLAQLVHAQPGERVVDACAGVGGKTLALSAQMHNQGKLFAYDVGKERLAELSRRARRAGARNIHIRTLPQGSQADAFLQSMHGKADRVLVDAPCSGLGALRRNPDARYRFQPSDFHRFPALQEEILNRFSSLVRKGGRLIYATCSIVRAENEIVAERFLHAHSDFRLIPAHSLLSPDISPGPFLKLFPHRQGTDGFFAAVFERT